MPVKIEETADYQTALAAVEQQLMEVKQRLEQEIMAHRQTAKAWQIINERVQNELALAKEIQASLLMPPRPKFADIEIVCHMIPARQVGGDFYAYHSTSTNARVLLNKYTLAVGDVSGKGVSAALLMATCLSQFDASLTMRFTPSERLAYLDKVIMPYTKPRRQNCALCYVEIVGANTVRPVLKVANAGCIPPYLKHPDGSVESPDIGGFALGQGLGMKFGGYQQLSLNLTKGDIIILTSDGVVEAMNEANKMFGFERLEQVIRLGTATSAEAMLDYLNQEIATFTGQAEQHDDMTIVVVKVTQ